MVRVVTFSADSLDGMAREMRNAQAISPTLGFIFASPRFPVPDVIKELSGPEIAIFGSSSCGEIVSGEKGASYAEHSIAGAMTDLDPHLFTLSLFSRRPDESSHSFGSRIGRWGREIFAKPRFIITVSGLSQDGEAIVRGIAESTPPGTGIFGGLSGDDWHFKSTVAFNSSDLTEDGAIVLLIDGSKVSVTGAVSSGWEGIGAEMVVTSSRDNVVFTINDVPATDVVKEHLKVSDGEILTIGSMYPLIVRRPDGSKVIRTFMSADLTTGAITCAGSVAQGSRVCFSGSFGSETIYETIRHLERFHAEEPDADFILLFSCMARLRAYGPQVEEEIQAVSSLWKVPVIGFFTYGEIGYSSPDRPDFFNESISVVLVSQKKPSA